MTPEVQAVMDKLTEMGFEPEWSEALTDENDFLLGDIFLNAWPGRHLTLSVGETIDYVDTEFGESIVDSPTPVTPAVVEETLLHIIDEEIKDHKAALETWIKALIYNKTTPKVSEQLYCPSCGNSKEVILHMMEWELKSTEDPDNTCKVYEHQCMHCNGKSFWATTGDKSYWTPTRDKA